jgi:hypothetical protein
MVINNVCVFFFTALYLPQDGNGKLFCSDGGATPYKLFYKVPWDKKQLASSDFTFRKRKKAAGAKYGK